MEAERERALVAFLQPYWPEIVIKPALDRALTHRSYSFEHNLTWDNERLEFLGDALIGFVASAYLFERFPESNEGELSKMKATLVSRSMLGRRARDMGLGELLLLGRGEEKGGGRHRLSLIGSALEALVGALFLEYGRKKASEFVRRQIIEIEARSLDSEAFTDYKSRFQELVQKQHQQIPEYRIIEESGPDHDKRFCVEVSVKDRICGRGWGPRKKTAENAAAKQSLQELSGPATDQGDD